LARPSCETTHRTLFPEVGFEATGEHGLLLLALALVIGSVSSHMPGRWRYHALLHGRVVAPKRRDDAR
jgi:hypothetical protein